MRQKRIPKKLKHDAIVEAILELRFQSTTVPEVLLGRLADYAAWKGFEQVRLAAADIPAPMRQADTNLRFQPLVELRDTGNKRAVRLGDRVLSYHKLAPYGGWETEPVRPALLATIDGLFGKADGLIVRRMGLRYINAVRSDLHDIRSVAALDLKASVADEDITGNVNLNFTTQVSDTTLCTVRIATKDFVQGNLPENTSALVDVDVYTKESYRTQDVAEVKRWLDFAHDKEKEQFFQLLTDRSIEKLALE
jgi:uncharacterized protein (TIGR04255 family)